LAAGNDVLCAEMTVDEAKCRCLNMPSAVGFTFQSTEAHPRGPVLCYFKSSVESNSDVLWQRYMSPPLAATPAPARQAPQRHEPPKHEPPARATPSPPADTLRAKTTKRRAFSSGSGVPKLKEENTLLWFQYIAERQRVFNCWFHGARRPWTNDPTLAHGRMCNNYRFLDRESAWSIAHIVEPLRNRPADLIFNVILFRCYLNWHRSMELLGLQSVEGFDRATFEAKLREVGAKLGKLSSAAYNVGSFHSFSEADQLLPEDASGVKPTRASAMFAQLAPLMPEVARTILERRDSLHTFKTLTDLKGVGRFLGWQCCLDLGYWNPAVYNESFHVEVGPGATEGLSWLFKDTGGLDPIACVKHLVSVQTAWFDKAGISADTRQSLFGEMPRPPTTEGVGPATVEFVKDLDLQHTGPLNLMAIEGALCEGNKYFRVRYNDGSGRFKQQYRASTGADARYTADYRTMISTLSSTWGAVVGPSPTPPGAVAIGFCVGKRASELPCLAPVRQYKQHPSKTSLSTAVKTKKSAGGGGGGSTAAKKKLKKKKKAILHGSSGSSGIQDESQMGRKVDGDGQPVLDPSVLVGQTVECLGKNGAAGGQIGRVLRFRHVFGIVLTIQLTDGEVITKRLANIRQLGGGAAASSSSLSSDPEQAGTGSHRSMDMALQGLHDDGTDSSDLEDEDDEEEDAENDHFDGEDDGEDDDEAMEDSEDEDHPRSTWQPRDSRTVGAPQRSSGRAVTKPKWMEEEYMTGAELQQAVREAGRPLLVPDHAYNEAAAAAGGPFDVAAAEHEEVASFTDVWKDESPADMSSTAVDGGGGRAGTPPGLPMATPPGLTDALRDDSLSLSDDGVGGGGGGASTGSKRKRIPSAKVYDHNMQTLSGLGFGEEKGALSHARGGKKMKVKVKTVRPKLQKKKPHRASEDRAAACKAGASGGAASTHSSPRGKNSPSASGTNKKQRKQQQKPRQGTGCAGQSQPQAEAQPALKLPEGYVLLGDGQFEVDAVLAKRRVRGGGGGAGRSKAAGQGKAAVVYEYLVAWKGYGEEENTWEPAENLKGNISLVRFEQKVRAFTPGLWCTFTPGQTRHWSMACGLWVEGDVR
jgi:hypothetical protein